MDYKVKLDKVPFYNDNTKQTKNNIEKVARMSDRDIAQISAKNAVSEVNKSKEGRARRLLWPATVTAIVAADVAKTKGPASNKLLAGALGLATFGLISGSFAISRKISEKASGVKENAEPKNVSAFTAGTLVGGFILSDVLVKLGNSLLSKAPEKCPGIIKKAKETAGSIDKWAADSNIINTVKKPFVDFAKNHPEATKTIGKYFAPAVAIAYFAGSMLLNNKIDKKMDNAFKHNVADLSNMRDEARAASEMLDKAETQYNDSIPNEKFEADVENIIDVADKEDGCPDCIDKECSIAMDNAVNNME